MKTPVAFIIFRRPDETAKVFAQIREYRPDTLLIIADGPRHEAEKVLTDATRAVVENIDWPCKVLRNYSDTNMGCKMRVATGITWVFENVAEAIILEDDCLPNQSFFKFMNEMLEKYRDAAQVMQITGIHLPDGKDHPTSYSFSNVAQIWGWATWKRAWDKYDVKISDWPMAKKEERLLSILKNSQAANYFTYLYQRMFNNELDTWDVAWTYTVMKERGLAVVPYVNLIRNIGFGEGAAHSKNNKGYIGEMKLEEMIFPLKHPEKIATDMELNKKIFRRVFGIQSRLGFFLKKVKFFMKEPRKTILKHFRKNRL